MPYRTVQLHRVLNVAGFGPLENVDPGRNRSFLRSFSISSYFRIAGPAFLIVDILTPLVQGLLGIPILFATTGLYALVGALAAFTPASVCYRIESNATPDELQRLKHFGYLMLATGAIWVLISTSQAGEGARTSGVIGALFPEVSDAQDALFGRLDGMTEEMQRTADGVEELLVLERERRDDPSNVLSNRGYGMDETSFWRAVRNNDGDSLSIMCENGTGQFARLSTQYFNKLHPAYQNLSDDLWQQIENCSVVDTRDACRSETRHHAAVFGDDFDWPRFTRTCGRQAAEELRDNRQGALDRDLAFLQRLCRDYRTNPSLGIARYNQEVWTYPVRTRFGQAVWNINSLCAEVDRF